MVAFPSHPYNRDKIFIKSWDQKPDRQGWHTSSIKQNPCHPREKKKGPKPLSHSNTSAKPQTKKNSIT
jgi:hypothetical protein